MNLSEKRQHLIERFPSSLCANVHEKQFLWQQLELTPHYDSVIFRIRWSFNTAGYNGELFGGVAEHPFQSSCKRIGNSTYSICLGGGFPIPRSAHSKCSVHSASVVTSTLRFQSHNCFVITGAPRIKNHSGFQTSRGSGSLNRGLRTTTMKDLRLG
jgi:hypothetical protein